MPDLALSVFPEGAYSRPIDVRIPWPRLAQRLSVVRPAPRGLPWACSGDCCRIRWQRPGRCPRCRAELVPAKRALPAWSPWTYGTHERTKHGAIAASALVLDYDAGAPDLTRWSSWAHVAHTTWSHTVVASRWRLVLPLASPAPAALWPRVWAWACAHDPTHDTSCSDPGRLYFGAWRRSGAAPWKAMGADGPWLDIRELKLPEVRPTTAAPEGGRDRRPRLHRIDDASAREAHGLAVGGRVAGDGDARRIVDAPCPRCRRPSVWWWVAPASWRGAGCDHRKSCGWTGWPDQVGAAHAL